MLFHWRQKNKAKVRPNRGFVILYAVLLTTVVLAIALTVATILTKQLYLSYVERSYQLAYYAADSGRQCAFFWDGVNDFWRFGQVDQVGGWTPPWSAGPGPTITFAQPVIPGGTNLVASNEIYCNKERILIAPPLDDGTKKVFTFHYDLDTGDNRLACVSVKVTKDTDTDPTFTGPRTSIMSNGFSVSCAKAGASSNSRPVQRTLELEY